MIQLLEILPLLTYSTSSIFANCSLNCTISLNGSPTRISLRKQNRNCTCLIHSKNIVAWDLSQFYAHMHILNQNTKCISTVGWVFKKNADLIKFQLLRRFFHNLILYHSKRLRDRLWSQTTWVYTLGMPLTSCVILGKSFTSCVSLTDCDSGQITQSAWWNSVSLSVKQG